MKSVRKAYGYVTRRHHGITQVLVFRHPMAEGGIQVPKGTMRADETPLEAVKREIHEETGLLDFTVEGEIAADEWEYSYGNAHELHERHFFLLTAKSAPDEWDHKVTGEGGDEGMVFHYFWISSPGEVEIGFSQGDYLDKIFSNMTAEEFIRLPREDGWHYELAEGRLVRMPLAGYNHDVVVSRLAARLLPFVEEHNLGECTLSQAGYLLSQRGEPDTVRSPDLAFVSSARIPRPNTPESIAFPRLAPDLVVEVVSPSQYRPEMFEHAKMWLNSGVRLVWIIWPQTKQVEVWQPISDTPTAILSVTDTLDGVNVVPGFSCPVARLFK